MLSRFGFAGLCGVVAFLSFTAVCVSAPDYAKAAITIILWKVTISGNSGSKRGIEVGEGFSYGDTQAREVLEKLKRQAPSTCECYEPKTEIYSGTTTETYMALPFRECTISATTSNLCPTDHICACQHSGTSICMPTSLRTATACGNPYTGPTNYPPTDFTWSLSSPLADFAFPTEQCGGTLAAGATLSWNSIQTRCPMTQSCVCQTASRFSRCVDATDIPEGGVTSCLTCRYEFNLDLPPPTATARLGGQCGGKCWTGPTNCPPSATCFTETGPTPGAYAECGLSNPVRQLKIRQEGGYEVMNVPARVQAVATPIYF